MGGFSVHYKKVLLRDRKKRTARGIASLSLLSGGGGTPFPVPGEGYPLFCLGEYFPVLSAPVAFVSAQESS